MKRRPGTSRRPALTPGRLPRVARIHAARVAAERDLTHERVAVNLGISPMRLVLLCERHGIDVRRAPGIVRHPPRDTRASDKHARGLDGKRRESVEREEAQRLSRDLRGGYVERGMGGASRMVWEPGEDRARPPLFSCYAEDGSPVEYNPPPLASLGEIEVAHVPVTPGPKRNSPAGAWGGACSKMAPLPRDPEDEQEQESRRRKRIARAASGRKRQAAEARC